MKETVTFEDAVSFILCEIKMILMGILLVGGDIKMLWSLLIGLIAGGLAAMISHGGGFGIWGNLVVGVIGSFIGGGVFNLIGISVYGTIGTIISSTVGAVILLWAIRIFRIPAPAYKKK